MTQIRFKGFGIAAISARYRTPLGGGCYTTFTFLLQWMAVATAGETGLLVPFSAADAPGQRTATPPVTFAALGYFTE